MVGYNQLAALIGENLDLAIFRRFMELNTSNLLCMQAELVNLCADLKRVILKDAKSHDREKHEYNHSISDMKGPHEGPGKSLQWNIRLKIRHLLREYNEALFQYERLTGLSPATTHGLSTLRKWLKDEKSGNNFLQGYESDTWHDSYQEDLASLDVRYKDRDAFSRWVEETLLPFYHKLLGHKLHKKMTMDEESGIVEIPFARYSDARVLTCVNALSAILASLLPTLSFFALYFITGPIARMGAIVGFTFIFSAALTVITKAKRVECFGATAAFAAVQVVWVGVQGPPS